MRSLTVIFTTLTLSVAVSGIDTTPKNVLEENILKLLTKWREGDKGPFSFPLPSLDEIVMPEVTGNYEGYGAKIKFGTSELKLFGLKNFTVESLNASEANLTASARISVPSLTVTSDSYDVQGRALWYFPVKGSGKLSVIFSNNVLNFSIKLRNNGSSTVVDSLLLQFKIGGVQAKLNNGPVAISTLLNNSGVLILQSYHEDIVKLVRDLIVPLINSFINDMGPEQLFNTIAQDKDTTPIVTQI